MATLDTEASKGGVGRRLAGGWPKSAILLGSWREGGQRESELR